MEDVSYSRRSTTEGGDRNCVPRSRRPTTAAVESLIAEAEIDPGWDWLPTQLRVGAYCGPRLSEQLAPLRCRDPDGRRSDVEHDDLDHLLIEHTDAWNSHDLNRLMSLFADDCVFEASAGPESRGRGFEGRAQVMTAFADVFDSMPDANWGDGRHFVISDDYGVSEWRLTGTLVDGTRVDVLGCDFLTVREDKIVRKNSFRKQRPPVAE